jgi:hypothetical protein
MRFLYSSTGASIRRVAHPVTNPKGSGAPSFAPLRRVGCKPLEPPLFIPDQSHLGPSSLTKRLSFHPILSRRKRDKSERHIKPTPQHPSHQSLPRFPQPESLTPPGIIKEEPNSAQRRVPPYWTGPGTTSAQGETRGNRTGIAAQSGPNCLIAPSSPKSGASVIARSRLLSGS